MARRLVVVPHSMRSQSAKDLAALLSTKVGHKVWRVTPDNIRNRVAFQYRAGTDKITQFMRFQNAGLSIPSFTVDRATALQWLAEGAVVCRTIVNGSEGRGIVIAESPEQLVDAPLYTRYFKKKKEFRVHVLNGEVIDVQEKRRKQGVENGDTRIRNVDNGYVFCRENITEPDGLRQLALQAVQAVGYNMGAVDVAYNEHHNRLALFEVNACPGMQGTTLENYANKIVEWYRSQA